MTHQPRQFEASKTFEHLTHRKPGSTAKHIGGRSAGSQRGPKPKFDVARWFLGRRPSSILTEQSESVLDGRNYLGPIAKEKVSPGTSVGINRSGYGRNNSPKLEGLTGRIDGPGLVRRLHHDCHAG